MLDLLIDANAIISESVVSSSGDSTVAKNVSYGKVNQMIVVNIGLLFLYLHRPNSMLYFPHLATVSTLLKGHTV